MNWETSWYLFLYCISNKNKSCAPVIPTGAYIIPTDLKIALSFLKSNALKLETNLSESYWASEKKQQKQATNFCN